MQLRLDTDETFRAVFDTAPIGMALLRPASARSAMAGFDHLLLPVLLMFGGICLAFGVALAVAFDILNRRLDKS